MITGKAMLKFNIYIIIICCLLISCDSKKGTQVTQKQEFKPKTGFEANMNEIRDVVNNQEKDTDWETIYKATLALKELKDRRAEDVFLKILERKEPIRLSKDSDIPGIMSPLNILKALALESLREIDGEKHLEEFHKIYHETDEEILRDMAKEHIISLGDSLTE